MTLAVYLVVAAAAVVFVIACLWRTLMFSRAPMHLRWELYPVPHEASDRVAHGGSYFEQSEWWRHARPPKLVGELKFMVPEMLFLHALRTFNRPLWYRSFPFHFGLYLLAATLVLLSCAIAAQSLLAAGRSAPAVFLALARVTGVTGVVSTVGGAAGLLHRRLSDPALKLSTTPGDIANLLFFIGTLALLTAGYLARPAGGPGATAVLVGLLTWDLGVEVPAAFGAGIISAATLAAYIPLTHMSHFIAKYFTYHGVRWDDEPMGRNDRRARAMAEYLAYRPTWSAPHIRSGESRTWADIVAENPSQEPPR